MRYDIDLIKSQLNSDNIISIMDSFNCPVVKANQNELIFPSIEKYRDDWNKHKPKLYYYLTSQSFYGYSSGWHGDIFSLIQHITDVDFKQSIEMVCRICCIKIETIGNIQTDNWKSIKRFLPIDDYQEDEPIKTFDNSILTCFEKLYPQSWLDEGITKEAMDKFNIGWYSPRQQITIPVHDIDGNLIGIHCRNTQKWLVDRGLKYQPLKTLNEDYRFPTGKVLYGLYENQSPIKEIGECILFEAPKSVLMAGQQSNAVAMFGWNCNKYKRDLLLNVGVKKINIALDRQYQNTHDAEFQIYCNQVKKIIQLFKPYCDAYVIWDKDCSLLGYKDSPVDRGYDVWEKLYANRLKIS